MNPAQTDEAAVDVERRLALHRLLALHETLAPRTAALVGFRHGRIHVFHERSAVARPFFEKRPARFHHDVGIEIEKPVGVTDRKSLLGLRGVGRESEAESVRFRGRRSDKSGPGSQTRAFSGCGARLRPEKAAAGALGADENGCERRTRALPGISSG